MEIDDCMFVGGWVGRESSHGIKELFNLPPLVLKTGQLISDSAICKGSSEEAEQSLVWVGGIPLSLRLITKITLLNLHDILSVWTPKEKVAYS